MVTFCPWYSCVTAKRSDKLLLRSPWEVGIIGFQQDLQCEGLAGFGRDEDEVKITCCYQDLLSRDESNC